jgi:hypothetical protein
VLPTLQKLLNLVKERGKYEVVWCKGVSFLVMSEFKTDQDFELKIFDCCVFESKKYKEVLEKP